MRALSIDPAERHGSAAELADELGRIDPGEDWQVTSNAPEGWSWQLAGATAGRADVIVYARHESARWRIEVWTQQGTDPPRKRSAAGPDRLWAKDLTWRAADVALTRAFRRLP